MINGASESYNRGKKDERNRIIDLIWKEDGIDFTGIQAGLYSINEIKAMLEKATRKAFDT